MKERITKIKIVIEAAAFYSFILMAVVGIVFSLILMAKGSEAITECKAECHPHGAELIGSDCYCDSRKIKSDEIVRSKIAAG